MLKRLFDLCVAVCVLLLLTPAIFVIAVWIKLDSKGPVFFRQVRVGRGGAEFGLWKFRSMHVQQVDARPLTVGADSRITRAGTFLRRHKVDELPQFLNVILGHMSVVGPRPELARYVALYPPELRNTVLSVRPGITDFASLAFSDESTLLAQFADPESMYVTEILPAKLALCERYVREQSLLVDLKIILKTISVLLRV